MSEPKFTPGPWSVPHFAREESCACDCAYIFSDSQRGFGSVATVSWQSEEHESHETCIANARLIAGSPDLLADLITAASTLRRYEQSHRAKGTEESTAKAEVNAELATRFEATIRKATA
ncbi:hypothetical protein [Pseudomonas syringae]|uniref:Uncharacterized protein n=1 Tax=Pseudomonas syringae TaxID=317 RepID=A0A085V3U8_PSESX|nr:hypothetical protein [Pseudomonas syringae]KFE50111.1 hypothetical protein IV01_25865 [Pseudomonas syringae]